MHRVQRWSLLVSVWVAECGNQPVQSFHIHGIETEIQNELQDCSQLLSYRTQTAQHRTGNTPECSQP